MIIDSNLGDIPFTSQSSSSYLWSYWYLSMTNAELMLYYSCFEIQLLWGTSNPLRWYYTELVDPEIKNRSCVLCIIWVQLCRFCRLALTHGWWLMHPTFASKLGHYRWSKMVIWNGVILTLPIGWCRQLWCYLSINIHNPSIETMQLRTWHIAKWVLEVTTTNGWFECRDLFTHEHPWAKHHVLVSSITWIGHWLEFMIEVSHHYTQV